MTDYEEPAAKILKLEIPPKDQEEEMDEGQEEWLSEGILTDDDYNPTADQDKSDVNMNTSQGDTTPSLPDDDMEDNSNTMHNSLAVDNTQTDSNSHTKDNSDMLDNLNIQDNTVSQDNMHSEDKGQAQDDLHTEELSHTDVNTDVQYEEHTQDNIEALDNTDEQDNKDAQDTSDIQDNSHVQTQPVVEKSETLGENIERTLNNFENAQQSDIPKELGAFLVRKTENKPVAVKKSGSGTDTSTKHSDDDGNDTDELLRMLGGDGQKATKVVKKVAPKQTHDSPSSDEDDDDDDQYIFEGTKVARLKLAKRAVHKTFPTKAVPESVSDRDDSDGSSDEGVTVKKMFVNRRVGNFAAKSTAKPAVRDSIASITRKMVTVHRPAVTKRPIASTPLAKPDLSKIRAVHQSRAVPQQKGILKKVPEYQKMKLFAKEAAKVTEAVKSRPEPDEIIDEEEFLEEEDEFDLDEDFHSEPEGGGRGAQRIMRPEQMDEEVPTDGESNDDDDSLYDEFPSSESDQEEWFTLDVRSERAGDYVPLLGSKAKPMLVAERQRVASRLHTLRQNISALNESSQLQADMVRRATLQLADLDAALKA